MMEEQDKKRNWMTTAQEKASERKDKDDANDKGKGEPRSEFEKQLKAEEDLDRGRRQDPTRKQQGQLGGRKGSPDDDLEMVDDRPGFRHGKSDASIKDGSPGSTPSGGGFGRAIFSDPSSVFQSPASGETPTGFLNAPANTDPDGFRRSASAERVDQMIGAPTGAATSGPGRASPGASPGASPYGVLELAGNVAQWTATPAEGGMMMVKGSAWDDHAGVGRGAGGDARKTSVRHVGIGFRCAGTP